MNYFLLIKKCSLLSFYYIYLFHNWLCYCNLPYRNVGRNIDVFSIIDNDHQLWITPFYALQPIWPSFVDVFYICFYNKIHILPVTFSMILCHLSCECLILESACSLHKVFCASFLCSNDLCVHVHRHLLMLPPQNSSCNLLALNWSCLILRIYKIASD